MILKDIVKQFSFEEVWKKMMILYPDQKNSIKGYDKVFKILKIKKLKKSKIVIILHFRKEPDEKKTWVDVSGKEKRKKQKLAIEFTPWSEWLGMEIEENMKWEFSNLEILCHCLWEMTWTGFSEKQIQKFIKKLHDSAKSIKKEKKKK